MDEHIIEPTNMEELEELADVQLISLLRSNVGLSWLSNAIKDEALARILEELKRK